MATYLALLRAVNLGSHNKVSMADLKTLLAELGMANPQSLLQSGNLVFPKEAKLDPGHTVLMCLRDAPPAAAVKALQAAIKGREVVKAKGRHAYFLYPDGIGNSKLTIKVIEKKLGTTGTARNWNTVLKLGALTEKGH